MSEMDKSALDPSGAGKKSLKAGLEIIAGAIPFVGGILSAAASAWSEKEQEEIVKVFRQWLEMLEDEIREKSKTIIEVMARLDMNDEKITARIESPEYQSVLKKAFRNWSNIDSESKRQKVRNLLANSAATDISTDDVVKLFLDWMDTYSDFHFEVIGEIYRNPNSTRSEIWENLGRPDVREDSADADLYKMLIRDLSMGGVIRQERATDFAGNFIKKKPSKGRPAGAGSQMKSAFDDIEQYVLTELGKQFVHYAMNELAPRIEFRSPPKAEQAQKTA